MKKILSALLTIALLGGATLAGVAEELPTNHRPAPALAFEDLATGAKVNLADLKGKVVVVDFWATWCVPCIAEVPGFVALQNKYGKDGLVVIGVSLDRAGPKAVKKFMQEKAMSYTVAIGSTDDFEALAGESGGGIVLPTTFLIGRDGNLVHAKIGAMPHDEYEAIVKRAL